MGVPAQPGVVAYLVHDPVSENRGEQAGETSRVVGDQPRPLNGGPVGAQDLATDPPPPHTPDLTGVDEVVGADNASRQQRHDCGTDGIVKRPHQTCEIDESRALETAFAQWA